MARRPKPWKRKGRGYYVTLDNQQIPLGPDKAEAERRFHALMLDRGQGLKATGSGPLTVRDLFSLFGSECEEMANRGDMSPVTHHGYMRFILPAADSFGSMPAMDLKPKDVVAWRDGLHAHKGRDSRPWGQTTRRNATLVIRRAFRWAEEQGHIPSNPIARLKGPPAERRELIPTAEQMATLVVAYPLGTAFGDLVAAIHGTGARPGEVRRLTAAMVDLDAGTWEVPNKTRRSTGAKTRTIHLTPAMVDLSRRLMERRPEGPIFRNRTGKPWTAGAMVLRFLGVRKRLGMGPELSANALRHLFATDALDMGIPIATVAELMGHRNTLMVSRIYSKLGKRSDHLKEAVARIRPDPACVSPDTPPGNPGPPDGAS